MANRTVTVEVLARVQQFRAGMSQATSDVVKFGGTVKKEFAGLSDEKMRQMGGTLTRSVTLPIVAAGAAAIKMGIDFETTFRRMQGLAGVAAEEVSGLRDAVLDLAVETGQSPQQLAEALYFVRSAGIDGAAAMEVLEVSAKGAAVGLGEAASIADLLTSVLGAYGDASITAAKAGDILVATAREGKAEASALAPQMGRLLPIASQLNIGFNELGGALAYLTRSGGGAELASTNLGNVLQKLLNPAQEGATVLDELGISASELQARAGVDLVGALVWLRGELEAGGKTLGDFSRDAQFLNGALALTADGGRRVAPVMDAVTNSMGAAAEAFEGAAQDSGFKLRQSMSEVQVAAIELGDQFAPMAAGVAGGIADIASGFGSLPGPAKVGVLAILGMAAAAGPILTVAGRVRQLRGELDRLGAAGVGGAAGLSRAIGVASGAAAGVAGIAALAVGLEQLHDSIEGALQEDAPSLDAMGLALVKFGQDGVATGALVDAFRGDLTGLAGDLELMKDRRSGFHLDFAEDFDEAVNRIDSVDKALAQLVDSGHEEAAEQILNDLVASFEGTGVSAAQLRAELGDYEGALDRAATKERLAAGESDDLSESMQVQQERVQDLTKELEAYERQLAAMADPLFGMVDATLAVEESQIAYAAAVAAAQQAQVDLDAAIAEHGPESAEAAEATLGLRQANIDLERALYGTATASLGLDTASQRLATAVANGETSAEGARAELERMAGQSGMTTDQIDQLIARFDMLVASVDGRVISFTVDQHNRVFGAISANTPVLGVAGSRHARGGVVDGPDTLSGMGSDTIAAALTRGEFVVNREAALAFGYDRLWRINSLRYAGGGVAGQAAEGVSGRATLLGSISGTAVGRSVVVADDETGEVDIDATTSALERLADTYLRIIEVAGLATAEQLLGWAQTAEHFDSLATYAADAAEITDNMFERGLVSTEDYLGMLRERQTGLAMFSDRWEDLQDQIDEIERRRLEEQRQIEDSMWQLGRTSVDERRAQLEERLANEVMFTTGYMDAWRELEDFENEQRRRRTDRRREELGDLVSRRADTAQLFLEATREAEETGKDFETIYARLVREADAEAALRAEADRFAMHRTPLRAASYDEGGWLMPGWTMAYNGTGAPERVGNQGGGSVTLFGSAVIHESVDVHTVLQQAAVARQWGQL